jgi:hypothetical protein
VKRPFQPGMGGWREEMTETWTENRDGSPVATLSFIQRRRNGAMWLKAEVAALVPDVDKGALAPEASTTSGGAGSLSASMHDLTNDPMLAWASQDIFSLPRKRFGVVLLTIPVPVPSSRISAARFSRSGPPFVTFSSHTSQPLSIERPA